MAAPSTPSHTNQTWHVGGVTGRCASCGNPLPPGTACWATLCDRLPMPKTPAKEDAKTSDAEKAKPDARKKNDKEKVVEESPFARLDFCEACWNAGKRPGDSATETSGYVVKYHVGPMFSFWKTIVPTPEQKKKLLVDDTVLVDVFERMEAKTEPTEVRFRFVLGLILMRKRLLRYEGMDEVAGKARTDGGEVWRMKPRGKDAIVHVINPHLTQEQIAEVSQQLSAILAEEV